MHASSSVRSAAVKAYVAFVVENDEDDKLLKTLAGSVPAVIQVCKHVVDTEEDDDSPLQCLADLASTVPKTISPHLPSIIDLCTSRHSTYIPIILRLFITGTIFVLCIVIFSSAGVGESSLDRIACALNGKVILQPFLHVVQSLLGDGEFFKCDLFLIILLIMLYFTIGLCGYKPILTFLFVISSYLPAMMEKLEFVLETTFKQLLEKGRKLVLEQVITTIASVADAAQDLFSHYYARLMPPLKYILQNSDSDEFKTLRGKTIECISLIGLAVGKETFKNDAAEIMHMLSSTMPTLSPDDPQCSYMISSWTRICKVLGPDFAPFLPMVMDPVLRAASYKPDVEDDPAWSFHSIGDNKNFGIRTSGLEEKATACEMIVCYARELKGLIMAIVIFSDKIYKGILQDADPEEAKEELDEDAEMEAAILARLSDIVHSGFKVDNICESSARLYTFFFQTLGENFFGLIEHLLPGFLQLIDMRRSFTDRQWGICIFDDMVEFAPKRAANYQAQFVPVLLKCLGDEYPEVRQAAAYGFGIMAMNGGAEYLSSVTAALEPLAGIISRWAWQNYENMVCLEIV
uniref:Importin subunit beta-4 n=1 Tax=Heterorhabditis bacteriophora TaxID=37862 RepID=A0A1I7X5S4_HETBA